MRQNGNLMQLVYGQSLSNSAAASQEERESSERDEIEDENFFIPKGQREKVVFIASLLISRFFSI